MRLIRKIFSKWYINLLSVLLPIVLGFIGYHFYYLEHPDSFVTSNFLSSLYSALRLFGGGFAATQDVSSTWVKVILEVARWLAVIPTGHMIISLIKPFIIRFGIKVRGFKWLRGKKQVLLAGNNDENKKIYASAGDKTGFMILAQSLKECEELQAKGYKAVAGGMVAEDTDESTGRKESAGLIINLVEKTLASSDNDCTIIINTQDDMQNLKLLREIVSCLEKWQKENPGKTRDDALDVIRRLRVMVFGDSKYQTVYAGIQEESCGIIRYINKYDLVAADFIENYPFTRFMDEDYFNSHFENCCADEETGLGMVLIGFGKTGQAIYRTSVSVNQYIERNPGGIPQLKHVKYHVFDNGTNLDSNDLNNSLMRYERDFLDSVKEGEISPDDYFPLPERAEDTGFCHMDVYGREFIGKLRDICMNGQDGIRYIIVCFGSDLENMDFAKRLASLKEQWRASGVYIFAYVRDSANASVLNNDGRDSGYITFGSSDMLVYNLDSMSRSRAEAMAMSRNLMYEYENCRNSGEELSDDEIAKRALYNWYKMSADKRMSNISAIMGFRMKLQLMGLDYRLKTENSQPDTVKNNEEYFGIYAGSDRPVLIKEHQNDHDKDIYAYEEAPDPGQFRKNIIRENLAVQEHYRWNAFMMNQGFIPESKARVLNGSVKDYSLRTHGNLTTFEGLFEFRREMAQKKNTDEDRQDVIKYDYQLMDDAWWYLEMAGCEMVKRWKRIQ